MSKNTVIILIVILVLAIIGTVLYFYFNGEQQASILNIQKVEQPLEFAPTINTGN